MLVQFKGLCECFSKLRATALPENITELDSFREGRLQAVYPTFWGNNQPRPHPRQYEFELLEDLAGVLQLATYKSQHNFADGAEENAKYDRVSMLGCCLSFYCDYYLALRVADKTNSTTEHIANVKDCNVPA